MAIEEVGVKLIADGEAQFTSALNSANQSVQKFGDAAKEAEKKVSDLDKRLESARKTSFGAYAKGLQQGTVTGKDFQSMLIGSADKAGLLSTDLARLTKSSGLFSSSQFKAAENMRAAAQKADELTAAVANGSLSARDAGKQFGAFTATLGTTQGTLAQLVTGFDAFIAAGTVIAGVVMKIGMEVKKTADEYMNYAFQVKDFGRQIGATPEEASKLIQVADDVRLSVESMTMAMRTAIVKGYNPTIAGLMKMSDEYLAIQDPMERARFAAEIFGARAGNQMAKLLEKGSAAIKEMGDSILGTSRLMTAEGIQAAQDYYDALDNLSDAWLDVKLSAGKYAVPALIGFSKELANVLRYTNLAVEAVQSLSDVFSGSKTALAKIATIVLAVNLGYENAANVLGFLNQAEAENTSTTLDQATALAILNDEQTDNTVTTAAQWEQYWKLQAVTQSAAYGIDILASTTLSAGTAMEQTAGSLSDMGQATQTAISDMARAAQKAADINAVEVGLSFKYPNIADQMQNLINSIKWQEIGGGAIDQFMQSFTQKIAPLTTAQQQEVAKKVGSVAIALEVKAGDITKWEGITKIKELSGLKTEDAQALITKIGEMTPPDISAFLNSIVSLAAPENTQAAAEQTLALSENITGTGTAVSLNQGLLSGWRDTTKSLSDMAREAAAQVGAVNTQLKSMPKVVDVKINISTSGGTATTPKVRDRRRAEGGPVDWNTAYLVGERGPELFIPDTSGEVIPNNRTMAMLDNILTLIPMAKGGKIGAGSGTAWEKAHNKAVKEREAKNKKAGAAGDEMGDIEEQGSSALEAIQAREEYTWTALRMNVAEYNALVKAGASPAILAEKKRIIDAQGVEAQALTKLRTEAELQNQLLKSQQDGTAEGLEQSSLWLQNLMNKFKDFFALLTSAAAKSAMDIINPLVSSSPAPLALGLSQIRSQMDKLSGGSLPRFGGSIAQLAAPNQITNSRSSVYNINVPVTATVSNQSDIKILAYAVAKEIAANVRS